MTRYRIVERRCSAATTFFIEYRVCFSWKRVQQDEGMACYYEDWIDSRWDTLEAARAWIAAKQAANAPCTTFIHQP